VEKMKMKVTFHLDGEGLIYDKREPIHLDSLLAYALAFYYCKCEPPTRDEEPTEIPLPLKKWHIGGEWGWKASALFPEGKVYEDIRYIRKKLREKYIDNCKGSPNKKQGKYREHNIPITLQLCNKMIAYANGSGTEVRKLLKKHIRYLGKKRAYGFGKIRDIEVEEINEDYSLVKNGKAMRYLPKKSGIRRVRMRPPYWNIIERCNSCEILENYNI
jgi:CRISPR type IV-associated protein Csf3